MWSFYRLGGYKARPILVYVCLCFFLHLDADCVQTYRLCLALLSPGHLLAITYIICRLSSCKCPKIWRPFFRPQGEEDITSKEIKPRTFSPLSNAWNTWWQYSSTHPSPTWQMQLFDLYHRDWIGSVHFIASHYFFIPCLETLKPKVVIIYSLFNMQHLIITADAGSLVWWQGGISVIICFIVWYKCP